MASTYRFALRLSLKPDNKTPARLQPEVFSTQICAFHKVRQLRLLAAVTRAQNLGSVARWRAIYGPTCSPARSRAEWAALLFLGPTRKLKSSPQISEWFEGCQTHCHTRKVTCADRVAHDCISGLGPFR